MSLYDGLPPAQWHSPTSIEAADGMAGRKAETLRRLVLKAIRESPDGLTDEEGISATGIGPSTYRPRRVECLRAGLVCDTGRTRKTASGRNAVVWGTPSHRMTDTTQPRTPQETPPCPT